MRLLRVLGVLRLMRPHPPPGLQSLQVRHLLPQEQDPLLLQRGLDLCQPHQRPRHLEVCRHLGDGVVGYCVGVLSHLVDGSLHLLSRPGQYVTYQLLSVEAGERRSELNSCGWRVEGGQAGGEGRGQGVVTWREVVRGRLPTVTGAGARTGLGGD